MSFPRRKRKSNKKIVVVAAIVAVAFAVDVNLLSKNFVSSIHTVAQAAQVVRFGCHGAAAFAHPGPPLLQDHGAGRGQGACGVGAAPTQVEALAVDGIGWPAAGMMTR